VGAGDTDGGKPKGLRLAKASLARQDQSNSGSATAAAVGARPRGFRFASSNKAACGWHSRLLIPASECQRGQRERERERTLQGSGYVHGTWAKGGMSSRALCPKWPSSGKLGPLRGAIFAAETPY